ncbi:site-specific DNA-methyltransferase [Leptospira interrogans]
MPGPKSIKASSVGLHKRRQARTSPLTKHALEAEPIAIAAQQSSAAPNLPWSLQHVRINRLRPAARRTRRHSKNKIAQLTKNIREFSFVEPIITDENLRVLGGHARLEAAKAAEMTRVPVIVLTGLSDTKKRVLALALNKLAETAAWDRPLLALELLELQTILPEIDLSIELTGFEVPEIDILMGELVDPDEDPVDDAVAAEDFAISTKGDVWRCGAHRIVCGDATNFGDFERLMHDQVASMVITDPPFNTKIRNVVGRGKTKHREFKEASGEKSRASFTKFLQDFMMHAATFSARGSIHFVFMDWRHTIEVVTAGEAVFGEQKNLIVWTKSNAGQGSLYRSQHELIFVFKNGDGAHINNVELGKHGRNRSNVWTYAGVNSFRTGRMDDLSVHPTVKPVALVADAMRDCSRRGDIVLDPFMGSGTTLLAAEKVGRRAFGIEIDPLYVDVAIRRWQQFTKQDAVLERTGETFDEVAARVGYARRRTS